MTNMPIPCPQCGEPVDPQTTTCLYCGVNVALASSLAEQFFTSTLRELKEVKISPEVLVPRLGDYLIEKGFLTKEDLKKALAY